MGISHTARLALREWVGTRRRGVTVAVVAALTLGATLTGAAVVWWPDRTGQVRSPDATAPPSSVGPLRTVQVDWRLAYRDRRAKASGTRVIASSASDVWGLFDGATVHYDGERWRTVKAPRLAGHQVSFDHAFPDPVASGDGVWLTAGWQNPDAETEDDEFVHLCRDSKHWALKWDGSRWVGRRLPCIQSGGVFDVDDSGEMWYFGTPGDRTSYEAAYRWEGSGWIRSRLPARTDGIRAADIRAPDDVWAVGDTGLSPVEPLVAHWDGKRWSDVPAPPVKASVRRIAAERLQTEKFGNVDGMYPMDVLADSSGEVWVQVTAYWSATDGRIITGDYKERLLYRYDGSSWHEELAPSRGEPRLQVTGLEEGADGRVWLTVNRPWLMRRTATGWERTSAAPETIESAAVTGDVIWAVAGAAIYRGA